MPGERDAFNSGLFGKSRLRRSDKLITDLILIFYKLLSQQILSHLDSSVIFSFSTQKSTTHHVRHTMLKLLIASALAMSVFAFQNPVDSDVPVLHDSASANHRVFIARKLKGCVCKKGHTTSRGKFICDKYHPC